MQRRPRLTPDYFQRHFGCGLTAEQLETISDNFGPLSQVGRKRLYIHIIQAVRNNSVRRRGAAIETPASSMKSHLRGIEDNATRLLELLGVSGHPTGDNSLDPGSNVLGRLGVQTARVFIERGSADQHIRGMLSWIPREGTVVGVVPSGNADEPAIAVTSGGSLNFVAMALIVLAEGARSAAAEADAEVRPGRGGARREGRTRSSALAVDLITVYKEMRRRYPGSGPVPGYSRGGPLSRFVLGVFAAVAANDPNLTPIPDASIGDLFYGLRKSKT